MRHRARQGSPLATDVPVLGKHLRTYGAHSPLHRGSGMCGDRSRSAGRSALGTRRTTRRLFTTRSTGSCGVLDRWRPDTSPRATSMRSHSDTLRSNRPPVVRHRDARACRDGSERVNEDVSGSSPCGRRNVVSNGSVAVTRPIRRATCHEHRYANKGAIEDRAWFHVLE